MFSSLVRSAHNLLELLQSYGNKNRLNKLPKSLSNLLKMSMYYMLFFPTILET